MGSTHQLTARLFFVIFIASGCSSNQVHSWRNHQTKVDPFPTWDIDQINGDYYPKVSHTHNLKKNIGLSFPDGYRWGVAYEVVASFKPAKIRPELADYEPRDIYIVKKIVSEQPVASGQCFNFSGVAPDVVKEKLSAERFLKLFEPNGAKFKSSKNELKFKKFLEDKKSTWFNIRGCFEKNLQIIFDNVRYDH